ncbi:MAG: MFS transporter [Cryobacterium sp.]|nr:MFS transporter [Oligoflexia bacterium]
MEKRTLGIMATATGICVANIYYCQPLLHEMQNSFGGSSIITDAKAGWIPTLTQIGYALGILFIVPLGDQKEKRNPTYLFTLASAIVLMGIAAAPTFEILLILCLLLGIVTTTPQFLIPFAAALAPKEKQGQVVGIMMSGLLLGILLARTVSGFVGAAFGWRMMYAGAGAVLFVLSFILRAILPKSEPTFAGNYRDLLGSLFALVKSEPVLRETMFLGGALFAAFSAFWATLIHLLESDSFHLGARTVGLFGLLGAAGALAAPIAGRFSDRKSARAATGVGLLITAFSFGIYILGAKSLIILAIGVVVMDVGVQVGHIANQSRVFGLIAEARSRTNTAYIFAYFVGGSLGSGLGSWAWSLAGWNGVCLTSLGFLAFGGLFYFTAPARYRGNGTRKAGSLPLESSPNL